LAWDTTYVPGKRQSPFANTHILGAPLVVEGKLYLLNEKADELRLLVVDLDRKKWQNPVDPEIEKTLVLTKVPASEQIAKSPMRRTQGLHLARAGDMLVCPTHSGELIGVDFAKMTVRWQYRYRNANVPPSVLPYWQAACPIVGKEHIVFTAADAPDVHCVGLDGKKKWTAAIEGGVYLATIFDDHALVVGKGMCRALKLSDGTEKWKLEMGAPAGVGVRAEARYYLPLKKDAINEAPTIWAIDLAKGSKAHRVAVPHPESLGNLALHRGMLVSQSVTHMAAFPQTTAK
jgi:outer membrane protein assembly factor BamB